MGGASFTPLFFVIGACPSGFAGMQAVMYSASEKNEVDFWWVKPMKKSPDEIEKQTLNRNAHGPNKNDPGYSKKFLAPLGEIFQEGQNKGGWRFSIETVTSRKGLKAPRACIECTEGPSQTGLLYLHLFWQEDWTSNPFARSRYIKGKIVYQKQVNNVLFFSRFRRQGITMCGSNVWVDSLRQYEIHDG